MKLDDKEITVSRIEQISARSLTISYQKKQPFITETSMVNHCSHVNQQIFLFFSVQPGTRSLRYGVCTYNIAGEVLGSGRRACVLRGH